MFVTVHIIQIIMQAVMLEKALYKVPEDNKLFEAPDGAEETEDEVIHFKTTEADDKVDDFKAV